ncbi:MAG: Ig-like domain-containing protein [Thiolinea sp.]
MKKVLQRSALALCVLTLAGCGGGDGNQLSGGTGDTGGTTDTGAKSLEVSASSRQLGSSGDKPVTISAIAKDANNNVLKDAAVTFSVNNDATIDADTTTSAGSVKTASLTPGLENPENRTLTVTVKSGALVKNIDVSVIGTTIALDGPTRIGLNAPTTFTAKLKNSADKAIANESVTVNSSLNNSLAPVSGSGFVTDANGELQFKLNAAVSGADTIKVSALGTTSTKNVDISGDDFALTSTNNEIKVNTPETLSMLWTRNGQPQANKTIKLAATRGVLQYPSVVTDAQGKASFGIASKTAGSTIISATDAETGLSASLIREFVAISPTALNMQVEQEIIAPEASTNVIAVVQDANDNPVKNQVVEFSFNDTVGGSLGSTTATTDSLGKATVGYTAGNASSAKDGVVIKSTLQNNPLIKDEVKLTVGGRALRLVLGEDEKITESDVFYKKTFGVIVTDSSGNPMAGKKVNFSITPTAYYKGQAVCAILEGTTTKKWIYRASKTYIDNDMVECANEDIDKDGWLDMPNEDTNNNGTLEPTHAATVTSSGVTDANGATTAIISYPQSEAFWSKVRLTATIQDGGTEFIESTEFVLPMLAGDAGSCDITPPNAISPYGVANDTGTEADCKTP